MVRINSVLVVAPHPDDEVLGCGGTLSKIKQTNPSIRTSVLYLSSGESEQKLREEEALEACDVLSVDTKHFLRFSKKDFNLELATLQRILAVVEEVRPTIIYAPHEDEGDIEHTLTYQQIKQVVWRYNTTVAPNRRVMILALYEIHKPLQRVTTLEDISTTIEEKRKAMSKYKSQLLHTRIDEAIEGLNKYRGSLHDGYEYAEAFEIKSLNSLFS